MKQVDDIYEKRISVTINNSEGELDFQVLWVSGDGRLCVKDHNLYTEALKHYYHLKGLKIRATIFLRLPVDIDDCEINQNKK